MDLKSYYHRLRELEQSLEEPFVVLVSHATPDGGREGLLTEVPRELAAKMIIDGRARLANENAAHEFREKKAEEKKTTDREAAANRTQATLPTTADLLKARRPTKE